MSHNSLAMDLGEVDQMFASFDIQELEVLNIVDGVALPEMGASTGSSNCCSSSSSSCCCC